MRVLRLWLRAAGRRRGRAAVLALGLVATTVATTAAVVAGDTLDRLFVADAVARWGPIDVEVAATDGAPFEVGLVGEVVRGGGSLARAWSPRLRLPAAADATRGGAEPVGDPVVGDVVVLGVTGRDRTLGPLVATSGADDVDVLGVDGAILNERLARRLRVRVGDSVRLVVAVPERITRSVDGVVTDRRPPRAARWDVVVRGVARDAGAADLGRGAVAFVRLEALQRVSDLAGLVTVVHAASARPGREAADDLVEAYDRVGSRFGLTATPVRADAIDVARDEGGLFRSIVLALAVAVAAGSLLLVVHLVGLLATERARELAVLRAIGLRARRVADVLTVEGVLAALAAAVAGGAVGIPVGAAVASRLAAHVASLEAARGHEQVPLAVSVRPATILLAAASTVVVAMVAVRAAARSAAGADVDAVLRGSPSAPVPTARHEGRAPLLVGLLLIGAALGSGPGTAGGATAGFAGTSLLLLAWWRARRPEGRRGDLALAGGLVWCVGVPAATAALDGGVRSATGTLVLAGAGAAACATALLVRHVQAVVRGVRAYLPTGRSQAVARTAASWAAHDRARTATVAGSVGVTVFAVAALAVIGGASAIPVDRQRGGFDVVAESVAEVGSAEVSGWVPGTRVVTVATAPVAEGSWHVDGQTVPYPVRAARVTAPLASAQGWQLVGALPGVTSAADALRRVAGSDRLVVLDRYTRPDGAGPGDEVEIERGGRVARLEVVAILDTFVPGAMYAGARAFDPLFGRSGATLVLAEAPAGQTPEALAGRLERAGRGHGLVAETVADAAADVTAADRAFTDIFGVVLLVGLGVGVVGAAASYARAAAARRREIGVLRAAGFRHRDVVAALVGEAVIAAGGGVVTGAVVGLLTMRLLFASGFHDLAFQVDAVRVGLVCGGTVVLVAAVTSVAALVAARDDLDGALRTLE